MNYVECGTDAELQRLIDDLNATYMADMRAKLGRGPGEPIDTRVNGYNATRKVSPRAITTHLVAPLRVEGVPGGLIPVNEKVRAYADVTAPSGRTVALVEKEADRVSPELQAAIAEDPKAEPVDVTAEVRLG